jgi:hypothetical protein
VHVIVASPTSSLSLRAVMSPRPVQSLHRKTTAPQNLVLHGLALHNRTPPVDKAAALARSALARFAPPPLCVNVVSWRLSREITAEKSFGCVVDLTPPVRGCLDWHVIVKWQRHCSHGRSARDEQYCSILTSSRLQVTHDINGIGALEQ